jgi:hypothetical protein
MLAEAVSKFESTRVSGVALPFPKCREADTARSDGSTFTLDAEVVRFDTASAESTSPMKALRSCR